MTEQQAIIFVVGAYFAIVAGFMLDWILELFEGD